MAGTLAALTIGVVPLAAQSASDQPTAFVHGFASDPFGWYQAGDSLSRTFRIRPTYPDLSWTEFWADQAVELDAAMAGESQVITVGHSNGGLVARVWNRGGGATDRIVTVGSLHQGAQLAERTLTGQVFEHPLLIGLHLSDAFRYYSYYESLRWNSPLIGFVAQTFNMMQRGFTMLNRVRDALANYGFFQATSAVFVRALYDMSPNSEYFTNANGFGLNNQVNLIRESQSTRARVGIIGRYGNPGSIMFRTLFTNRAQPWINWRYAMAVSSLSLFDYYEYYLNEWEPYYPDLHDGAWRWLLVTLDMLLMDVYWVESIGALREYVPGEFAFLFEESDGIVPESSQQYPGRTNEYVVLGSVTHTQEKQSPRVLDRLVLTFENDFLVPSVVSQ